MPSKATKRAQVSFFTNYLFSAVTTRTHTPTLTHSVFTTHNAKKNAINTFFLKLLFFALYSFSLTPKHFLIVYSGKLTTKNCEKAPERRKKIFFSFYNFFHIFPLPLQKKKNLLFPPFLSPQIGKPQGKTSHKKCFFLLFFFDFFSTLPLLVIAKITTYLFFRNSDLKCPKRLLSALKFHFLQIIFFPP